jgi:putative thioredoxin
MTSASPHVLDVTTADFERDVLERSLTTPVLVDFWATWCGPCKTLSPVLEKLADELDGAFVLAKVDIDANMDLAQAFGVQSVPTVALVKDGSVVDGFLGARGEAEVRAFLEPHLGEAADGTDAVLDEAQALEHAGDLDGARLVLRDALVAEPDADGLRAELARLAALCGEHDEARAELARMDPAALECESALTAQALIDAAAAPVDLAALEAAVAADPKDVAARLTLGRALLAKGRHEDGLEQLYQAALRDLRFDGDAPRKALIEAFGLLGEQSPLTLEYRRRLSLLLCA